MDSRGTRRPAGGRLPLLVASGVALVLLGACSGSASDQAASRRAGPDRSPPAANHEPVARPQPEDLTTTTRRFDLDLTDGIPVGWDSQRATVTDAGGTPSVWVRIAADGNPAYVELPPTALGNGQPAFELSGRFRVERRTPGETVGLATVENSAREHHADLFVDRTSGRCRVDLFQDDTAMSPRPCDDGRWHHVTMTGDYGSTTYTLAWTLDGVAMPPIRSTAQPPATARRLWLGDATPGKTNVIDWTGVTLRLGSS
jgi:hypothetical protein